MIRNDRLLILGPARSWLCRRRLCKRIVVFRLVPHLRISFIDVFTYFQVCMYNCRNSNSKVVVVVRIYPKFAVNIVFCECNSVFFLSQLLTKHHLNCIDADPIQASTFSRSLLIFLFFARFFSPSAFQPSARLLRYTIELCISAMTRSSGTFQEHISAHLKTKKCSPASICSPALLVSSTLSVDAT